jgi:enoyl-CoA hydratase
LKSISSISPGRSFSTSKARDIILSDEALSGTVALEIGLAKELATPEFVLERALFHARALAKKPPAAFAGLKTMLREVGGHYRVGEDRKALDETIDRWFSPEAEERKRALRDTLLK